MGRTIVALSTPLGYSGLAVIRLSGPRCRHVLSKNLKNRKVESHRMRHGFFFNSMGDEIDKLNYVFMASPDTSTGEDVLEIYPHGNPLLSQKIIDEILNQAEIDAAQPGEFTRKSLENGKLDLIQAEAVGELIHARTHSALANAHRVLNGRLSKPLTMLKEELEKISVQIELDVDFVEEEIQPNFEMWKESIETIRRQLSELEKTWERRKAISLQPRIGLFGKPNAGKSSLINAILNSERLIVSSRPGTTRDYVEVSVNLNGGTVTFIDTAGIGISVDDIDAQAMQRSLQLMEEVHYKILLVDGSISKNDIENKELFDLLVSTKADLTEFIKDPGALAVSSKTGAGIANLLGVVSDGVFKDRPTAEEVFITTERQHRCLINALDCMNRAAKMIDDNPAVELLAFEIKDAHQKLAELIGEYNTEEMLERLFSGFCIGK